MTRRRVLLAVLFLVALAGAGVAAWSLLGSDEVQGSPSATARAYLEAWEGAAWDDLSAVVLEPPDDLADRMQAMVEGLEPEGIAIEPGAVREEGDRAIARFEATVTVGGLGTWSYEGFLDLVQTDGAWWVSWSPAAVHPSLDEGERLDRTREWPPRAAIRGAGGVVLAGPEDHVEVGVEPQRVTDRQVLFDALEEHLGIPPDQVRAQLDRTDVQPHWFLPLTTLRLEEFEEVRADIHPVPGTVFRVSSDRIVQFEGLAPHIVGRTGEITAELLERWGSPYRTGDIVGLSGLELALQDQLAGRPSGDIRTVTSDAAVEVIDRIEGDAPRPVETTLDVGIQQAAQAALEGLTQPAALVAIDAPTGAIRAVVSLPTGEFNRALDGRYPPGSTFKVVTAAAALSSGVTPDQPFECPAQVSVGGRRFGNAGGEALGTIAFREAFFRSCNTVFAPLGADLERDELVAAAENFGFNAEYELPLPAVGGEFPAPGDDAEAGAAGIGQGRVVASPMHMASVAATVAAGAWHPPHLVADQSLPEARRLEPDVTATLQEFMRLVVSSGTGQAAALPGRTLAGKTGTAEFGGGNPPPTHAWFVAFEGDLAAAFLVEGGGFGGQVAAPLAARFFSSL